MHCAHLWILALGFQIPQMGRPDDRLDDTVHPWQRSRSGSWEATHSSVEDETAEDAEDAEAEREDLFFLCVLCGEFFWETAR